MREILFRGKSADNGEWIEGAYYKQEEFYGDKEESHIIIQSTETLEFDQALEFSVVIPETVGQYTGLTDKNGNKIFEGDIIKDRENALHIVKIGEYYPEHYLRLCCNLLEPKKLCNLYGVYAERITNDEYKYDCFVIPPKNGVEVIGNIHDNPELLKGGDSDA